MILEDKKKDETKQVLGAYRANTTCERRGRKRDRKRARFTRRVRGYQGRALVLYPDLLVQGVCYFCNTLFRILGMHY